MSTEQSSVDPELVEQTKQQIRNLVREIAQIAKSDVGPQEFYDAVLNRIVTALAAVGGAVWTVTETGQLALDYHINLRETRLDKSEEDQVLHGRLLRKVITSGEGMLVSPHSGGGNAEEGGNPTDYLLVLGPLKTANETAGVIEVFQRPAPIPTCSAAICGSCCRCASWPAITSRAASCKRSPIARRCGPSSRISLGWSTRASTGR